MLGLDRAAAGRDRRSTPSPACPARATSAATGSSAQAEDRSGRASIAAATAAPPPASDRGEELRHLLRHPPCAAPRSCRSPFTSHRRRNDQHRQRAPQQRLADPGGGIRRTGRNPAASRPISSSALAPYSSTPRRLRSAFIARCVATFSAPTDMPDRALASASGRSSSFARPSAVRCACGNLGDRGAQFGRGHLRLPRGSPRGRPRFRRNRRSVSRGRRRRPLAAQPVDGAALADGDHPGPDRPGRAHRRGASWWMVSRASCTASSASAASRMRRRAMPRSSGSGGAQQARHRPGRRRPAPRPSRPPIPPPPPCRPLCHQGGPPRPPPHAPSHRPGRRGTESARRRAWPTSCIATGRPPSPKPDRRSWPGQPVTLKGMVKFGFSRKAHFGTASIRGASPAARGGQQDVEIRPSPPRSPRSAPAAASAPAGSRRPRAARPSTSRSRINSP